MFETLVDVFLDALIDSLKILPFLFGVYLLIEVILILGLFLVIPLIIMVIPTTTLMDILIRCPLILRLVLKNL